MKLDLPENNRKYVRLVISYGCNLGFFFVYYILGYLPRKVKGGKALGWNQKAKRNDKTITGVCENKIIIKDNTEVRADIYK